jgi:hypothetical protein
MVGNLRGGGVLLVLVLPDLLLATFRRGVTVLDRASIDLEHMLVVLGVHGLLLVMFRRGVRVLDRRSLDLQHLVVVVVHGGREKLRKLQVVEEGRVVPRRIGRVRLLL